MVEKHTLPITDIIHFFFIRHMGKAIFATQLKSFFPMIKGMQI